jgi:uncharacterized repeat protein (TIGR03803 family)
VCRLGSAPPASAGQGTSSAQSEQDPNRTVTFTTLLNFPVTNGGNPQGNLVQGFDGNLYGAAYSGGTGADCPAPEECGTVFKVSPNGTVATVYNFCSQANCTDGALPDAALVMGADGNFYGITDFGGANSAGTAFKVTPTGTLTTLHNWCSQFVSGNCIDGAYTFVQNQGTFVQADDGNFYGTNNNGGNGFFDGTFFKLTPTGELTTLYSFCSQGGSLCTDGTTPSGLIQATDGNFYGTTQGQGGGATAAGTVFKITRNGTLTTLHNFCPQGSSCPDGGRPLAPLVQAANGNFYGTTTFSGSGAACRPFQDCGTVFEITPGGVLRTIYGFCAQSNSVGDCVDGRYPAGVLVQATDGNLYGTTSGGGANGTGTIFRVTPQGVLTTLHSFDASVVGIQGGSVGNGMVQATDGNFYGTTFLGGNADSNCFNYPGSCGTVFRLSVGLGPFVKTVPTAGTVDAPVTILGTDLSDVTHVFFNHREAAFKLVSNSEIQTSVPAGATTGSVTVTRHGPRLMSNVPFVVVP